MRKISLLLYQLSAVLSSAYRPPFSLQENQVTVASVGQLYEALKNPQVFSILALKGTYAWSEFPKNIEINRILMLESEKSAPVLFQVDRLPRVSVVDGGVLVLVGVAMSQCLVDGTSNGCLASLQSGGMAIISNSTIYEESCDVDEGWLNQVWRPAAQQHGLPPWTTPGSRWDVVVETPELPGVAPRSLWQFLRVRLVCGSPVDVHLAEGGQLLRLLLPALVLLSLLATLTVLGRAASKLRQPKEVASVTSESAEHALARFLQLTLGPLLGKGSFGRVYQGCWQGQEVAVKLLDLSGGDPARLAVVRREFEHGQACCHANLVQNMWYHVACLTRRTSCNPSNDGFEIEEVPLRGTERWLAQRLPPQPHLQGGLKGGAQHWQQDEVTGGACPAGGREGECSAWEGRQGPALETSKELRALLPPSVAQHGGGRPQVEVRLLAAIVMQYVEGGSLLAAVRSGRFLWNGRIDMRAVYFTCVDILEGLQYLHTQIRVVHRDLSCANVLLQPSEDDPRGFTALLSDFGLSVAMHEGTDQALRDQGTLDYMPPECLDPAAPASPAADMYSFGIVLYTVLQGRTPFQGMKRYRVMGLKLEQGGGVGQLPDSFPQAARDLIAACTAQDPGSRPSAAQAKAKLLAMLRGV